VHLGADRGQHVVAGGRVGEPDRGVPRLDHTGLALLLHLELVAQKVGLELPVELFQLGVRVG
jgi:hypothetical protein